MNTTLRILGVTCLCAAGILTAVAIVVDLAGSNLYHLGSDHE